MGKKDLFKKSQMEMSFRGRKLASSAGGERRQRDLSLKEKQNRDELPRKKRSRLRGKE